MPPAIQCRDLRKTYDGKVEAVRGLSLAIEVGECFGLLGPNGAGKTTTIEILEGLLEPTEGDVEVLGLRWGEREDILRQRLGISLQETRLSEKLTVRETLTLFRSFYLHGIEFAVAEGQAPPDQAGLHDLPGVRSVRFEDGGIILRVAEPHVVLPALLDRLRDDGRDLARLTTRHASLEDVFVQLTGRHLRDEEATSA